jgi:hypothetical protein
MDEGATRPFFRDAAIDGNVAEVIETGLRRLAALAPRLERFAAPVRAARISGDRELLLDVACALVGEADIAWSKGEVLEALAFEGLEARVIEHVVGP